jgi:hypothetical protein
MSNEHFVKSEDYLRRLQAEVYAYWQEHGLTAERMADGGLVLYMPDGRHEITPDKLEFQWVLTLSPKHILGFVSTTLQVEVENFDMHSRESLLAVIDELSMYLYIAHMKLDESEEQALQ